MGKRKNMEREKMKGKRSYEIQGRKRDKLKKVKICTKETGNRKKEKIRVRRDKLQKGKEENEGESEKRENRKKEPK